MFVYVCYITYIERYSNDFNKILQCRSREDDNWDYQTYYLRDELYTI